jgi:hypothetical protein
MSSKVNYYVQKYIKDTFVPHMSRLLEMFSTQKPKQEPTQELTQESTNLDVSEKYSKDTYVTLMDICSSTGMNNLKLNPGLNIFEGDLDRANPHVGFRFTTIEYVDFFITIAGNMGSIAIVEIPDDAKTVKHGSSSAGILCWTTDKIILREKYCLFEVETIKKLGFKITDDYVSQFTESALNNQYGFRISNHETVVEFLNEFLKFCKQSEEPLENYISYTVFMLDYACKSQNICVLEWMKTNGFFTEQSEETKRSLKLLMYAFEYNADRVLKWWETEIYPYPTMKPSEELLKNYLCYHTTTMIKYACKSENICVLEWMKTNGFFTKEKVKPLELLNCAYKFNAVRVLNWWETSIYPTLDHEDHELSVNRPNTTTYPHPPFHSKDVLQWWERFENKLKKGIKA